MARVDFLDFLSFAVCLGISAEGGRGWLWLTGACFTWTPVLMVHGLHIIRLNVLPLCEREQVLVSVLVATVVST